jgi:hypothetical protein
MSDTPTPAQVEKIVFGDLPAYPDDTFLFETDEGRLAVLAQAHRLLAELDDDGEILGRVSLWVQLERNASYHRGVAEGRRQAAAEEREREEHNLRLRRALFAGLVERPTPWWRRFIRWCSRG